MKGAAKAGAPAPPARPDERDERGAESRDADDTESVAGEEDPGSALEQFSDLMNEAPRPNPVPGSAEPQDAPGAAPAPPAGPPRRRD